MSYLNLIHIISISIINNDLLLILIVWEFELLNKISICYYLKCSISIQLLPVFLKTFYFIFPLNIVVSGRSHEINKFLIYLFFYYQTFNTATDDQIFKGNSSPRHFLSDNWWFDEINIYTVRRHRWFQKKLGTDTSWKMDIVS